MEGNFFTFKCAFYVVVYERFSLILKSRPQVLKDVSFSFRCFSFISLDHARVGEGGGGMFYGDAVF